MTEELSDIRLGRPSASSLERISLCPGSHAMESQVPRKPTADSEFGESGHSLAALYFRLMRTNMDWPAFNAEHVSKTANCDIHIATVVGQFIDMARQIFQTWTGEIAAEYEGTSEGITVLVEERIVWLDENWQPVTTGQPDVVFIWGRHALVLDLKSLYGEQTEDPRNLQLRGYAVLVKGKYGCTEITVKIAQPRVSRDPQACVYHADELVAATEELAGYVRAAMLPNAPIIPGDKQCRLCRARSFCRAAAEFTEIKIAPDHQLKRGEGKKIAATITLAECRAYWEKKSVIFKILTEIQERLLASSDEDLAAHRFGDRNVSRRP